MADLYLKDPKTGEVVVFDEADAQGAANAGYQPVDQATYAKARQAEAASMGQGEAVKAGLLQAPADYSKSTEFLSKVVSGATFGLGAPADPESAAYAQRYQTEHPYAAAGAEMLGQAPAMLLGGAAGSAVRGAAEAGGGLLARAGGVAADYGINAAVGGAQMEAERARTAGDDFSFTDAAIAGVGAEVLGRGAAWGISKGVGGARNLVARAGRDAVAADAERTLSKGGWVGDYRTAQHADVYHDQLADLGAKDLDTLETATAEVGRQDKKRARIMRSVVERPAAQHEINVASVEGLQRLRGALADELESAPSGPAKRLAKQLDDRIAALEETPRGKKLWRILDENRQALQEYRQDLHQAYDTNPGSAWLSREGLAAIDAAEEATRNALLREDAWGEAAARMQREYNVPFHEKWFPARKTVLSDLHFATGKDAQGFTTYRGEPGKLRAAGDGAVADQQDMIIGVDGLGRLLGAAHDLDRNSITAKALDRRGQSRGHALDDQDDRRRAGRGGEARLAFDHGAAGERKGRAQMARLARFVISRDQRRKRHTSSLAYKRRTVSARGLACQALWSGVGEFRERGGDLPDHRGVAGGALARFVGENDQAGDSEARGDALEAGGRDFPIGVAARPAEQVELARGALGEGGFQLRHQVAVIADGGGERGVQSSGIVGHFKAIRRTELTHRFISGPKWYTGAQKRGPKWRRHSRRTAKSNGLVRSRGRPRPTPTLIWEAMLRRARRRAPASACAYSPAF